MEVSEPRCPRSIRLTKSINDRLITVCEHLGVSPTSYLISAVGRTVTLDEQTFISQKNTTDMVNIASEIGKTATEDLSQIMSILNEPDVKEFLESRKQKQQNLI